MYFWVKQQVKNEMNTKLVQIRHLLYDALNIAQVVMTGLVLWGIGRSNRIGHII